MKTSKLLKYSQDQFRKNGLRTLLVLFITATIAAIGFNRSEALVASDSDSAGLVDLSLTKQVSPRPLGGYRPGQQIVYQLVLSNASTCRKAGGGTETCADAVNVQVKDELPPELTFVISNPVGTYNPSTGIWDVVRVNSGKSQTLQILAIVKNDASGSITNYAEVWRANPDDVDSSPGNGSRGEDDDAGVTISLVTAESSISGNVYVDNNDNGVRDQGEAGIGGVKIILNGETKQGNSVSRIATTQSNGTYIFTDLNPGTYKLLEAQPDGYLDGKDAVGSAGGTLVVNDLITDINLGSSVAAVDYNFGELPIAKSSIAGNVYIDANDNGVRDQGEAGIGGVKIVLSGTDIQGNNVYLTTNTQSNGYYIFANLQPGTYKVTETQPNNFADGKDSVGSAGGTLGDDQISDIKLGSGVAAVDYNFGELPLTKSSIAGNVYIDANDNGVRDQGEAGIGGVKITLVGTEKQGGSVSRVTNTQSDGSYIFTNLLAGTYKIAESQPPDFLDGKDSVGSAGGTLGNDLISDINLNSNTAAVGYDFGELTGDIDLAIAKSHTDNFTAGTNGVYTLTITNVGNLTTAGEISVVDTLPGGMTFVSGTGDGWTCGSGEERQVVCNRSTPLSPGNSTKITLTVSLATRILSQVVNVATVSTPGDKVSTNNTAKDTTLINTTPPPAEPVPCETGGGSVLLFPLFASDAINTQSENTRITLTNTNQNTSAVVHLFFIDGATCAASDAFVCLTQNQTVTFLASDLDPGTTGYIVAVAVNNEGCPINFNHLIGQADVKLATGHSGSYLAEKFSALFSGTLPECNSNSSSAVIGLDGVLYSQPANQLAVPMIPSLADGNNPLLVLVRTGGNLATNASPLGSIFGVLYNDQENAFSFSFSSNTCQLKQALTEDFPRTAPRITQVIPSGRTGWMRLGPSGNNGVAGLFFNTNTNQSNIGSVFTTGVPLPKLRCGVDSFTVPVFPPSCQ